MKREHALVAFIASGLDADLLDGITVHSPG